MVMELIKWLSVADRYTKMQLDRQFAPLGLNSSQHMYIITICQNPGMTQEQFYRMFYLNPSNITRSLNALIKTGFITKEPNSQDRRTYVLYPTRKAYHVYDTLIRTIRETEDFLLDGIPGKEQSAFIKTLKQTALRAVSASEKEINSDQKKGITPDESDTNSTESSGI